MNIFTIELIQAAISFLPFLIAFTLMFTKSLGKYWILPTAAFIVNSLYRLYALYEVRDAAVIITGWEDLLTSFAPSVINILLFLGLLSIQISLMRSQESQEHNPTQLLTGPSELPHTPAKPSGTEYHKKNQESADEDSQDGNRAHKQEHSPHAADNGNAEEQSERGKKKILTKQEAPLDQRISKMHIPRDRQKQQEMKESLAGIRTSLEKSLEIVQYNGALKKPRKKKIGSGKQKRKKSS